jgi:hypothetical protein
LNPLFHLEQIGFIELGEDERVPYLLQGFQRTLVDVGLDREGSFPARGKLE